MGFPLPIPFEKMGFPPDDGNDEKRGHEPRELARTGRSVALEGVRDELEDERVHEQRGHDHSEEKGPEPLAKVQVLHAQGEAKDDPATNQAESQKTSFLLCGPTPEFSVIAVAKDVLTSLYVCTVARASSPIRAANKAATATHAGNYARTDVCSLNTLDIVAMSRTLLSLVIATPSTKARRR
jgi:hypothetical protein